MYKIIILVLLGCLLSSMCASFLLWSPEANVSGWALNNNGHIERANAINIHWITWGLGMFGIFAGIVMAGGAMLMYLNKT